MKFKFTLPVLAATLTFYGATAQTAEAKASFAYSPGTTPDAAYLVSTVFRCVPHNNSFATIAQRGDRTTTPIITWNTTLGKYTPKERCNIVSQKLSAAVARNGGKLRNLQLTAGAVNNQEVICVVNNVQPVCNRFNMLFTLRPESARRPNEVLARLYKFSVQGNGNPIRT